MTRKKRIRYQELGKEVDPEWVLCSTQKTACFPIFLKCLPGFLIKVLGITWVSKNFSLLAKTTTQTVFGLLDELTIHVKRRAEVPRETPFYSTVLRF